MSKGPIVTGVLSVLSMGVVVGAFLSNANPYVDSIAEARRSTNPHMHLAGDIVRGSVKQDFGTGRMSFELRDSKGSTILVNNLGEPPSNMGAATKVVAVGAIHENVFDAEKLLVKCPSKYEGAPKKDTPQAG